MRISQLVEESGVSLPTVKFYLREGLLPSGASTGARSAEYGERHLRRLRVIKALTDVAGLPLARVKVIIGLIDRPGDDLMATLGAAIAALPPDPSPTGDYPRARAVLTRLGQVYDPDYPAVAQLEQSLLAAAQAGLGIDDDRIDAYGRIMRQLAEFDLDHLPLARERSAAVEHAVLGTALYEPVLLALRRLAHQQIAMERLDAADG